MVANALCRSLEIQFEDKNRIAGFEAWAYAFLTMSTNSILAAEGRNDMSRVQTMAGSGNSANLADDRYWDAVVARDRKRDGEFFFAVSTTGVYCRPSCGARRPRRENVQFFQSPQAAEQAGYRACLRCRPRSFTGHPETDIVKAICR